MLVDSHCHLNYDGLREDIEGAISRASEAGVGFMLSIGTRLRDFAGVLATAEAHDNVACTVGIHPHESGNESETDVETLVKLTKHPKVIGIGETGLDFYYDNSPREAQERSFRTHIAAARTPKLPEISGYSRSFRKAESPRVCGESKRLRETQPTNPCREKTRPSLRSAPP